MSYQPKYFREDNEDNFFSIDDIIEQMEDEEISETTITRAKAVRGIGFFYCKNFQEITEQDGMTCGKICTGYKPRNGTSGICKHHSPCYEEVGEPISLKL